MAEQKQNPPQPAQDGESKLTAAAAAKRVKRVVTTTVVDKNTKATTEVTKEVSVGESEVLSYRDYGTHVVVVTKDGQKLTDKADA